MATAKPYLAEDLAKHYLTNTREGMRGMKLRACLMAFLLALPACSPRVLSAKGWTVQLGQTQATVRLVSAQEFGYCSAKLKGCTAPLGHGCLILLDRPYFLGGTPRQQTLILAHEVGHCLDGSVLEYSHAGFKNQGRIYGDYFSTANEGYAEAYARAYLAQCGTNLSPLGWGQGPACELPDPRRIQVPTAP